MTDYRTFRRGVDDFYNSTSQNVSASVSYKHTRRGVFANALVMHSWSHSPYTPAQQLFGDYIVYSYSLRPKRRPHVYGKRKHRQNPRFHAG